VEENFARGDSQKMFLQTCVKSFENIVADCPRIEMGNYFFK
jgi:hypothetical protein